MGSLKFEREILKYKKLYLDTACFIYYFERNHFYLPLCKKIFDKLDCGKIMAITSILTMTEVLILPKKKENLALEKIYKKAFMFHPFIFSVNVDYEIADLAATLRSSYNLKTPDAIHLATAIFSGAKAFITNDPKLKQIKEIPILVLREYL